MVALAKARGRSLYDLVNAMDKTAQWQKQFFELDNLPGWLPCMMDVIEAKPGDDVLPPVINKPPPGAPRGTRQKGALERSHGPAPGQTSTAVQKRQVTCSTCGGAGHYHKTCPKKGAQAGRSVLENGE